MGDSDDFSASSLAEVRAPEGETRWCFAVREGGATRAQDQDGMRVEVLSGRLAGEDESGAVWRTEEGVGRQVFGGEKRKVSSLLSLSCEGLGLGYGHISMLIIAKF